MPEESKIAKYRVRATLPKILGSIAAALLALTVIFIGVGLYRGRSNPEFRMKGFPTSLSQDIVAEVNGYERRETEGDAVKYFIKADHARTFSDNHQELDNVFLEVFDQNNGTSDKITATKAVYVPGENKTFTAFLAGSVNVGTRDGLVVKTEQVTYRKVDETAQADEQVEFERGNVKGRAFGAVVNVPAKRLELHRDVFIETLGGSSGEASGVKYASINAGSAVYDQLSERVELHDSVKIAADAQSGSADISSGSANVFLFVDKNGQRDAKKIELFGDVGIKAVQKGKPPVDMRSAYALFEKELDRFTLKDNVNIATAEGDKPVNISGASAVYEHGAGKVFLDGLAQVAQGENVVKGDHIDAELTPDNALKFASAKGNSYLKQVAADRTVEINSAQMDAAFGDGGDLANAKASGGVNLQMVPVNVTDYSKVTLSASAAHVAFKGPGRVDKMETEGRTNIGLEAPENVADAANKRVIADTVRAMFNTDGSFLRKTEAAGNAELYVEPRQGGPAVYKTTITAPRFDCEFYETGNDARLCRASTKAKLVRVPTQASAPNGVQVMTADRLAASFSGRSRDVEQLDAEGSAKFTELDRSATADRLAYTPADGFVRLRGGDPTVWDSAARARADEIDWDTKNNRSGLRGKVRTTYYSQRQTGGAAPFGGVDKPVYLTAAAAEFDHDTQVGLYTGNARGWQDSNFVTADKFLIKQKEGQFIAEGNVKSLLYNAQRREGGRDVRAPVYAAAVRMSYSRDPRQLRYEEAVDIRQGTDRIMGGAANVFLNEQNEVARTEIQTNVVITQPNRKATGDYADYIAAQDRVVLRGSPARVDDSENGSSQAAELTVFLKDNVVTSEGRSKQNPSGRSRSVYKVKESLQ